MRRGLRVQILSSRSLRRIWFFPSTLTQFRAQAQRLEALPVRRRRATHGLPTLVADAHRAAPMERHVRHSRGVGQQLVASGVGSGTTRGDVRGELHVPTARLGGNTKLKIWRSVVKTLSGCSSRGGSSGSGGRLACILWAHNSLVTSPRDNSEA
jgi:hypothetical protein